MAKVSDLNKRANPKTKNALAVLPMIIIDSILSKTEKKRSLSKKSMMTIPMAIWEIINKRLKNIFLL